MRAFSIGVGAVCVALVTVNAFITREVWRAAVYERAQKIAQTLLIWLLPGGAFLVWRMLREANAPHAAVASDEEFAPTSDPFFHHNSGLSQRNDHDV